MNGIIKDFYKADIFRFDLEHNENMVNLTINNSISWDVMQMRLTKEEAKGLADFIYDSMREKK